MGANIFSPCIVCLCAGCDVFFGDCVARLRADHGDFFFGVYITRLRFRVSAPTTPELKGPFLKASCGTLRVDFWLEVIGV